MAWRKADDSMEEIAQAPNNKSHDTVVASENPDRLRRHNGREHPESASHKERTTTLLRVAYVPGSALSCFSFGVVNLAKGPPVLGSLAKSTTSTPSFLS